MNGFKFDIWAVTFFPSTLKYLSVKLVFNKIKRFCHFGELTINNPVRVCTSVESGSHASSHANRKLLMKSLFITLHSVLEHFRLRDKYVQISEFNGKLNQYSIGNGAHSSEF